MKQEKIHYNSLLRSYIKNVRRLHSLRAANRNERRQKILTKHIERLQEKLQSLRISLKRGVAAAGIAIAAVSIIPESANAQSFAPMQTNPFNLTNVNGYGFSNPALGDLDGDGDLDLISGIYSYGYGPESGFEYFENTGSLTAPSFAAPVLNPFGLTNLSQPGGMSPTLVDIDGDGDLDIMAGDYYGDFRFYVNTGTSTAPAFSGSALNPFSLSGIGYYSNAQPTFADLDNDGDLDMIMGDNSNYSYQNNIYYFENDGTANAPNFATVQTNPFNLNPTGYGFYYLNHMTLSDVDGDGDFDLIMGDEDYYSGDNIMKFFENTGSPGTPNFGPEQSNPFGLEILSSKNGYVFADLDGDGLTDILAGDNNRDFYFWKRCQNTTSTINPTEVCQYTAPSGTIYTASGTYTDVIPNATNCDSIITINLTIDPISEQTFTDNAITVCENETATLQLSGSQNTFSYYLRNDLNDTIVDGPISGNGSTIDFSTGNLTTSTTYNVYAEKLIPSTGLTFDGGFDFGETPGISINNSSFSIEFYAKRATTGNDDYIVSQGTSNPNDGLHIGFRSNNSFTFAFFSNDLNTTNTYTNSDWHHYAVTYDNLTGERIIYVDGVVAGSDISASTFTGTGSFRIGTTMWTNPFGPDAYNGNLDELRIWSTVRTQTEIMENMDECLTGAEAGLISYYQFEDGSGQNASDETTNGNDLTLYNNTDWDEGSSVCSTCNTVMTQTATVTVTPTPDVSVTNANGTLTATTTGATYQWVDCDDNNSPINGETGQTFTPTITGNYAVEITENGCTETSACENVIVDDASIAEQSFGSSVNIYPNPTSGVVNVDLGKQVSGVKMRLVSIQGQELMIKEVNDQKISINMSSYPQGVYIIHLSSGDEQFFHRVIKN